jgi:hypothetical protein
VFLFILLVGLSLCSKKVYTHTMRVIPLLQGLLTPRHHHSRWQWTGNIEILNRTEPVFISPNRFLKGIWEGAQRGNISIGYGI